MLTVRVAETSSDDVKPSTSDPYAGSRPCITPHEQRMLLQGQYAWDIEDQGLFVYIHDSPPPELEGHWC